MTHIHDLNSCFYGNCDKKNNIKKKKKENDKGKKNASPTRLQPGTFIPPLRLYHKATKVLSPFSLQKAWILIKPMSSSP